MPDDRPRVFLWSTRTAVSCALAWGASGGTASAAELRLGESSVCVTVEELSFRVERALGQPLAQAAPLELIVSAVHREPSGFSARVEISEAGVPDGAGLRSVSATSCEELLDTLALALALAIGSRSDRAAPSPNDAPGAVVLPLAVGVVPPAKAQDAPVPPDDGSRAPSFGVRGELVLDTGSLPRGGAGVALGAGLAWPSVELQLLGTFLPRRESRIDVTDPQSPGVEMGLVAGSLSGCVPLAASSSAVDVALCAGWELGMLSGQGTRVDDSHHQRALWSAARIDLEAGWRIPNSPFELELRVSGLAPLTRDDFILKDIGGVHRPAAVVGRAGLGVRWEIE
jgi:hypothetical protein